MPSTAENPRHIPSVDRVVRELGPLDLPRPIIVSIVRAAIAQCRGGQLPADELMRATQRALHEARLQRLRLVINATGIIIHTNLGRSPLAAEAIAAMTTAASGYTNLEFDLQTGHRGGRGGAVEQALALLCEAEAAAIVNNCAATLVLVLHHFTKANRKQVIISRGELVQIGGGFRIPDILQSAGAILCEVGTTNRTAAADYAAAIGDQTAMILKVHHSNFAMSGFVESASLKQLALMARAAGVPLVDDLGSGAVAPTIAGEPTPADSVRDGADLVLISGDKLLGGPQAGIIAGRAAMIGALKTDPMFRALRCDKLILSALQATADLLLSGRCEALPIRRLIATSVDELHNRASAIVAALRDTPIDLQISETQSRIGGGAAPEAAIPSVALAIEPRGGEQTDRGGAGWIDRLRAASPPIIGYIDAGRTMLDLRTVFPQQDAQLIAAIRQVACQSPPSQSHPE